MFGELTGTKSLTENRSNVVFGDDVLEEDPSSRAKEIVRISDKRLRARDGCLGTCWRRKTAKATKEYGELPNEL